MVDGVEMRIQMRIHVVCSLTLSPSCPYNFGLGVQERSLAVVSNSLLSLLPFIW